MTAQARSAPYVRQAAFLVGGKGTRLGELTRSTPKPLLEIAPGVRFLDIVLEEAARHGFTEILLLAGHHGDQVESLYQGRRVREATVTVLREPEPMGTGGALRFAAAHLSPWFLMGNGDSLFEANLRALCAGLSDAIDMRIALREVDDAARYGAVEIDGDKISRFLEKSADLTGRALINGGLYAVRRDGVLPRIQGPCSIERDVFPALAAEGRLTGMRADGYFLDMGLPETFAQACAEVPGRRRRAAFLDRDGVLNVDHGYTHRVEDLVLIDGAAEAVRALNDAGYFVIVVTNQAGVARGLYGEAEVARFHEAMREQLAAAGAFIDAFYHCPYHEEGTVEAYRVPDHPDRKPNPGMILRAMQEWPIDPVGSFLIGDKESDLAAARAAGLPGRLFTGGNLREFLETAVGA